MAVAHASLYRFRCCGWQRHKARGASLPESWYPTMSNTRRKLSSVLLAIGAVVAGSGLSASAAPSNATGQYAPTFYFGLSQAYATSTNLAAPVVNLGDSAGVVTFCVEPATMLNLDTAYDLTAVSAADYNAVAKSNADGLKRAQYLLRNVTYYGTNDTIYGANTSGTFAGGPVVLPALGTLGDKANTSSVIGTAITTGIDVVTNGKMLYSDKDIFAIDMEYAAFQAAIRKLLDPTTDFNSIDAKNASATTSVKTRAQALYDAAMAYDLTKAPAAGPNGVEISVASTTSETSSVITASFTGLFPDGSTAALTSGVVTLSSTDPTVDLDSATAGVQSSIQAAVSAAGKLIDAKGATGVTIPRPSADAAVKVTLEQAIAPGTVLKTLATGSTTPAQQLATAQWAKVSNSVAVKAAVTATATTAPGTTSPTKLPMSGPVTSLPLLLAGSLLGAFGLWVRRRPA